MMVHLYKTGGSAALGLLLGGCAVYVPMQGAAPDIRAQGEVEATAGWSLTNRLDVGATYSPLPHLLVRAAASTKGSRQTTSNDSSSYAHVNQYELALGTYWPLGAHWLVGGLMGFGRAHTQARYDDDGNARLFNFKSPQRHQFDGSYGKYSGEVYAAWQTSRRVSLGLSYRVVQVRLTDVADFGVPVRSAPILRSEPMFFVRLRPRNGGRLWQMQLALGSSTTFGYRPYAARDEADPVRQFKLGQTYAMLGVALYPHLLWRNE